MSSASSSDQAEIAPTPLVPLIERRRLLDTRLPLPLTSFVGREREAAAVAAILQTDDVRLLVLTGPGGVGKTRLALKIAADLDDAFEDGVAFVALAPIVDPALVPATISRTLGVQQAPGQSILEALKAVLQRREFLLVLDNLEHLLDAAPAVVELLAACPWLKVLASSRAVLHVSGEHNYQVPPLPLPPSDVSPADSTGYAAITLFMERARAARADFVLTDANARVVVEICRRLDGLPLAIELAAARVAVLPLSALLARLGQRLSVLTVGPRDQPLRLRTMRAAIAWTHDLLSPDEQSVYRRLAVFAGGFTLAAAEAVCGDRKADGASSARAADTRATVTSTAGCLDWSVLERLASLVGQSLIQRAEEGVESAAAAPRFSLLETIREDALERLEASGEAEATRRAHADYFLTLAAEFYAGVQSGPKQTWLARLEPELDNLRAALGWSLERGEPAADEPLAAALGGLWMFWYVTGQRGEEWRWLERALAASAALPAVRAEALFWAGVLAWTQGDHPRAAECFAEALALERRRGARLGTARALFFVGLVACNQGRPDDGEKAIAQALALSRELGDRFLTALTLLDLYIPAFLKGDRARAEALCEEALGLWRELGNEWGIGLALRALADVVSDRGDARRAAALYGESLALYVEQGEQRGIADSLSGLAGVAGLLGRPEAAARLFGAAETLYEACQMHVPPPDRPAYEPAVARARAGSEERSWAAAWAAGRMLPEEQAVAEACAFVLSFLDEGPTGAPGDRLVAPRSAQYGLSARELDVLRLVIDGRTDREIAATLFISRRTVTTHVSTILTKMGVDSRTAAAAHAVRHRLV